MELDRKMLFELIQCVKREVSMRYRVYPKRIASGYMTEQEAEKEKRLMYQVQILLQNVYNDNMSEPVQQSFINAQEYIRGKQDGRLD